MAVDVESPAEGEGLLTPVDEWIAPSEGARQDIGSELGWPEPLGGGATMGMVTEEDDEQVGSEPVEGAPAEHGSGESVGSGANSTLSPPPVRQADGTADRRHRHGGGGGAFRGLSMHAPFFGDDWEAQDGSAAADFGECAHVVRARVAVAATAMREDEGAERARRFPLIGRAEEGRDGASFSSSVELPFPVADQVGVGPQ